MMFHVWLFSTILSLPSQHIPKHSRLQGSPTIFLDAWPAKNSLATADGRPQRQHNARPALPGAMSGACPAHSPLLVGQAVAAFAVMRPLLASIWSVFTAEGDAVCCLSVQCIPAFRAGRPWPFATIVKGTWFCRFTSCCLAARSYSMWHGKFHSLVESRKRAQTFDTRVRGYLIPLTFLTHVQVSHNQS